MPAVCNISLYSKIKNITGLTVFSWFKNPLLGAFTKKDVTDRTTPQQIIFVLAHHSDRQK